MGDGTFNAGGNVTCFVTGDDIFQGEADFQNIKTPEDVGVVVREMEVLVITIIAGFGYTVKKS